MHRVAFSKGGTSLFQKRGGDYSPNNFHPISKGVNRRMKLYKANRLMMVCLMATGLCFSFAQVANANDPHAGKYELVVPEQPTTTPDKVEVVELFWYTCPHCKIFEEKFFKQWRAEKPEDVEVIHMPAVFNRPGKPDQRIPLAKAFYIAKALGI